MKLLDFVWPLLISYSACSLSLLYSQDNDKWLTQPEDIKLLDGFRAELVYAVPFDSQGSWVAMTTDPQGRLIASDQYGQLYRLTMGNGGPNVERLALDLGGAHGLLCAYNSLYVMLNQRENSGLFRVWDSDGDDMYDKQERILAINGQGEHGAHAIIPAAEPGWLYVCAGNHTDLPDYDYSHVPEVWDEDHLLPRFMDPGGHAAGIEAPGGWVCRVTKDGSRCELVTVGFRNEYDIAMNHDDELFTFDADMEWDLGAPWYRPTRINHVIPGTDYGWRSGSSKWPAYYIDSLPAAIEVGPGSPTGVTFGYGTSFPEKYQQALFVADWSQGRLLAAHLKPDGATYQGEWELFASAAALPITDMVVNQADGALYFAIGGRKTQSAVFRIVHDGQRAPISRTTSESGKALRALRRQLERLQHPGVDRDALELIWTQLGHSDRVIRHAARVALEHQPIHVWKSRLEPDAFDNVPQTLSALVALARLGHRNDLPLLVRNLCEVQLDAATVGQQLDWLRVLQLGLVRLGPPDADRQTIISQLSSIQDTPNLLVQRELATILVYLRPDGLTDQLFDWLSATDDRQQQIHLSLVLRMLADEFSAEQSARYFELLKGVRFGGGGKSYGGYIDQIAEDAFARLPHHHKALVEPTLDEIKRSDFVDIEINRPFVKQWTVEQALGELDGFVASTQIGDLKVGRQLFAEAQCVACHRSGLIGGVTGPDLTNVGGRLSVKDLLVAMIEPDQEISNQYINHRFELSDGRTVVGRIINLNNDTWFVNPDMRNPGELLEIERGDVESIEPSKISTMPSGLLDTLSSDEIGHLLSYLMSSAGFKSGVTLSGEETKSERIDSPPQGQIPFEAGANKSRNAP